MILTNGTSDEQLYQPKKRISQNAYVKSMSEYRTLYQHSIDNPIDFWFNIAKQFHWRTPITKDKFWSYNLDVRKGPVFVKCFEGATTNMCYNLLDRHIKLGLGDKIAFYWEGNDPQNQDKITYTQLYQEVCKFANVLKSKGVTKGDRVAIYMPMILETIVVILACTRIGAIHSVVFAGFSATALADRILDCKCKVLVTADGFYRGEKLVCLQSTSDAAMNLTKEQGFKVDTSVVVRHQQKFKHDGECEVIWREDRDVWYHEEMEHAELVCDPEWLSADDPLFMLYTSGSTGKPKGALHTIGGYLVFSATTFKYTFDYKPEDVYWCTADAGWITCHTYVLYGPLANGATSVIFEGTPYYPTVDRLWAIIEKYKVNQFYTAPTAIRALMRYGEEYPQKHDLSSLKILGSVGEPINPEAWIWYHEVIGREQCSVVDTFFQTETGGHVITPLPGCTPTKPGSATLPFFGIVPELLDENGHLIEGEGEGYLVFGKPWPGMMRTVFGDHKRFEETYFSRFPGYYCSGDGARRDKDGYLWITGRIDDKLNVSGHLLSTADVESCLTQHSFIMEAAVVSRPHSLKGECLYCFVTPKKGVQFSQLLVSELKSIVREKIGAFAVPDIIHHAPGLPKTRSGKIMRRILRRIAVGDRQVGETSTLIDESVIENLFQCRPESQIIL